VEPSSTFSFFFSLPVGRDEQVHATAGRTLSFFAGSRRSFHCSCESPNYLFPSSGYVGVVRKESRSGPFLLPSPSPSDRLVSRNAPIDPFFLSLLSSSVAGRDPSFRAYRSREYDFVRFPPLSLPSAPAEAVDDEFPYVGGGAPPPPPPLFWAGTRWEEVEVCLLPSPPSPRAGPPSYFHCERCQQLPFSPFFSFFLSVYADDTC